MSDERGSKERSGRRSAGGGTRWLGCVLVLSAVHVACWAQETEPLLPRPGAVVVLDVIGEAVAVAGEQRKPLMPDERLRVGSTVSTERMSLATLILSNGTTLRIGSESELEVEEFGQSTIPSGLKFAELKAEPTLSRTRLRLERGDVLVDVKPLNVSRGSSFQLSSVAGVVRSTEGKFHVRVRMSDLGLGVCTIELEKGAADFEPAGGKFFPLLAGRRVAYALELDRLSGVTKVSEMPPEAPKGGPREVAKDAPKEMPKEAAPAAPVK